MPRDLRDLRDLCFETGVARAATVRTWLAVFLRLVRPATYAGTGNRSRVVSRPVLAVLLPDVHRLPHEPLLTLDCSIEKESEISPTTIPPAPPPKDPHHQPRKPPTWDGPVSNDFRDYRKDLAVLQTSGGRVPTISRNPPTASSANSNPPWAASASNGGTNMANSVWSSFFNDSDNDDVAQLSPGFAPTGGNSREDAMGFPRDARDDRRPSVASAMTASSSGSRSSFSRGFHKKLQNVFGEDFPGDGRQNSDSSLNNARSQVTETQSLHAPRNRGNSLNNTFGSGGYNSRPTSPTSSRPRTPQPSSEVTPWEFQEPQVSPCPKKLRS